MAVFGQGHQKGSNECRAAGRGDRIDLAVGTFLLRLSANGDQSLLSQPVQCRVDRPETRLNEVLITIILEKILDLITGGVATGENPQADCANVHAPVLSILVRYRSDLYMVGFHEFKP